MISARSTQSGASVWALLDQGQTVGDLAAELARAYDAEESQIAADVEPVLSELVASGFVTVDD